MKITMDARVGSSSRSEDGTRKVTFKVPRSGMQLIHEFDTLESGVPVFLALTTEQDGTLYQLGTAKVTGFKRDDKGEYTLYFTGEGRSVKDAPDHLLGAAVRLLVIEPKSLEEELQKMKQEAEKEEQTSETAESFAL